jgi:hypothetical protein
MIVSAATVVLVTGLRHSRRQRDTSRTRKPLKMMEDFDFQEPHYRRSQQIISLLTQQGLRCNTAFVGVILM